MTFNLGFGVIGCLFSLARAKILIFIIYSCLISIYPTFGLKLNYTDTIWIVINKVYNFHCNELLLGLLEKSIDIL